MRHLLFIVLLLPSLGLAQDPDASVTPAAPGRCEAPEHRQFDFWLGEWNVSVTMGGCVLQENWQGAGSGGISGTSFNIYDRDRGVWHQTWVDANGTLLQLDGGLNEGSMVLEGERPAPVGGGSVRHRIAWTPQEDGSVRQLWEASQDGGESWNVIFDGLYTRVSTP
jgi:hypothetical protein